MHQLSPPESVHALDLEALRRPEITFWSVRRGPDLLGCGALKELDAATANQSMRTVTPTCARSPAASLMRHSGGGGRRPTGAQPGNGLEELSRPRPLRRLRFRPCGPFADYLEDPTGS